MKRNSLEIRRRALELLDEGHSPKVIVERLGIHPDTLRRWRKRRDETRATAEQHTLDDEVTR